MPSPFPGMNPYLERAAVRPDFHSGYIHRLRALLAPRVRPRYFVRVQEHVYLHELPDRAARLLAVADLTPAARGRTDDPFRPRDDRTCAPAGRGGAGCQPRSHRP